MKNKTSLPDLSEFTNKYSLSKTLKFELIPQPETLKHIHNKGFLKQDEQRAESYKKMKKIIDEFHKYFIELAMQNVYLTHLDAFSELYFDSSERKKEDFFKKDLERVQGNLRKEIAKGFQTGDAKEIFSKLFGEKLIKELLVDWIDKQENSFQFNKEESKKIIEDFKDFTTYFGGFHENRKNIYSDKEQSTSIAYRLIHENLPKFLDNIRVYERLKSEQELYEKCNVLYQEIKEYLDFSSIDDAFEISYFNNVLSQKQINTYNLIIGGRSLKDGGKKIQGVNEYINLYNQRQKDKSKRIPKMKILYKQILSDRESNSFVAEKFEDSKDVLEAIKSFYHYGLISFLPQGKENSENVLEKIKNILADIPDYDVHKIYIRNDKSLTNISKLVFTDRDLIKNALDFTYRQKLENSKNRLSKKQENDIEKYLRQSFIPIDEIDNALFTYRNEVELLNNLKQDDQPIANYFRTHFKVAKKDDNDKEFDFISNIEAKYSCIKGILENYSEDKELHQDKIAIDNIKLFLDALMDLVHFVKPLILPNDSTLEKDDIFYGQLNIWYEQLNQLIPLYNKVHNYATQKPYSTEKFKLNFENKGQFLGGWVDSHTESSDNATQSGGYLFRKKNPVGEYDYYLGVSADSKLFRSHLQNEIAENDKSEFERLDYYQLKSASVYGNSYQGDGNTYEQDKIILFNSIYQFAENNQDLRIDFDKYISSQKNISQPTPSGLIKILKDKHPQLLKDLMNNSNFKSINQNITEKLKKTILSLNRISKSQQYKDRNFQLFTEPIKVIEELSNEKSFSYFPVSKTEFEECLKRNEKRLFLFKINNKDLSFAEKYSQGKRKSRGNENIHTMYFRHLMSGAQNIFDVGTGEIFYRKSSIPEDKKIVHKANEPIDNKNPNAIKKQSIFKYDLIKNKRFTVDKFQFHLSMIMNYQQPKKPKDFELEVNKHLQNNPNIKIIGIDRGERNLIYISLIDQKGNILKQESLNTIVNEKSNMNTSYHTLLANKEEERDRARKNWGVIENIKELKEGYLSQVVHIIAKMMVDHNAIVVMEDLNFGFKRGRFKVEKQIYQKLEKKLIDKLNYLVFKDKSCSDLGGLYNALQLTNKFNSFKEMGKQSGFLFYVPAWNTSKIDPTTGFVNLFNTKYESVDKAQKFFECFKSICFNSKKDYFEFAFDYNDFTNKAEGTKTDWTVCSFGDRIRTFRDSKTNNKWKNKVVNLTEGFEELFGKNGIFYKDGKCIKEQIIKLNDKDFFKSLLELFKLMLQMRNSIVNSEIDYLISPVMNTKGEFYDSRYAESTLPKDADANGAYHIAQKGLMVLQQINKANDLSKLKLAISNKDWLNYIQSQNGINN